MPDILVRNVDAHVAARLKEIAEQRGTSVQQVAHELLVQGTQISREELVKRITERAARMKPQTSDSTDIIRAMRDGRIRG
jgi:predicted alpha/beta-hydrolase family hydrolase